MNNKFLRLGFFAVLFATTSVAWSQGQRASPADSTTGKIGEATVTIRYNSPSVKGRKVWGELVPYGKAWRAGANGATTFETDKAVMVEGKELPAGKYSVFIVAGEKEWQFIFNTETGQWGIKRTGEANFDPAKNALTVMAKPQAASAMSERLVYQVGGKGFTVKWENLEVPVAIK